VKKETAMRMVPVAVTIPLYVAEWLRGQISSTSSLIEAAVVEKYGIAPPHEECATCAQYGRPQCEATKQGETTGPADWCAGFKPIKKRRMPC
jgi:hypothetical protein